MFTAIHLQKSILALTLFFSAQVFAGGNHGPGQQVAVNQLNDISPSLQSGLQALFDACAQMVLGNNAGCTLENMGTTRDPGANYGAKNSCHKNRPSDAVDIGKIQCGGATMAPKDPNYMLMAKCLANQEGLPPGTGAGGMQLKVIYGNGAPSQGNLVADPSGKHDDHIHAMVPGCSHGGGDGPASYGYAGNYEGEGRGPASTP